MRARAYVTTVEGTMQGQMVASKALTHRWRPGHA